MYLFSKLESFKKDIHIAFIGCGKFVTMFLAQLNNLKNIKVNIIVDLDIPKAKDNCLNSGLSKSIINDIHFSNSINDILDNKSIDIVIEATGNAKAGILNAKQIILNKKNIIMVNVEADVVTGKYLSDLAFAKDVVYSMAYGDQPALTAEIIDWARSIGFYVSSAGKGTKYLPEYHKSTPDTVWNYYGISNEEAQKAGMNSKMFNSFLDGTKSSLEMAAIANACELSVPENGLLFPPCGMDDLASILKPKQSGGILTHNGQVEVVSSLERDGRPVFKDLRWGVYAVLQAPNDYAASCFKQYGMNTDGSGEYSAMYKPFHLIGMELNISVFSAALLNQPTGQTKTFAGDVVATAKRYLQKGEVLDGEGGSTVWGKLIPSKTSLSIGALPIGLAHDIKLNKNINEDQIINWDDVDFNIKDETINYRKQMEKDFKSLLV